ncbi:hypothetical protein DH2020_011893 [Rehmannia glutinosa]|uniref:Protein kinase domain-containing protein n=1 Tax=Rehmannia glutinosa TaxID=99300 RepID=A0ABR0XEN7_REHGL
MYNRCLLFFIILLSKRSSGAHYQYEACGPKNCGAGPNISFPFYIPGLQESYCGYPGFMLNCSQEGFPVLHLPQNDYEKHDASSGPIRLRYYHGPPFVLGLWKSSAEELVRYNVSCDGSEDWVLALYDKDENLGRAMEICERNVVAPVEEGYNGLILGAANLAHRKHSYDDKSVDSRCPGSFQCGNLGTLEFPLSDRNGCGLFLVEDCNSGNPRIQFGADGPCPAISVPVTGIPSECSVVRVPIKANREWGDISNSLTAEYIIEWNVSDACYHCHHRGGQCLTNNMNEFHCDREKSRLALIISTNHNYCNLWYSAAGGGVLLILCLLISYIIWQRKKRINEDYLLSRNISSDPSSKSDIEGGSFYFGIPIFSYTELEEATNNFDPSKELGDGGFGTVYYGKLRDGREVAIKRLYEHNFRRVEQFMNEIKILTCLRHRISFLWTPGYVDPEYHQCYQLTDKSDVYSFGVVLIELISSMRAVDITRHRHEINLANLAVNRIQRCAFDELIDPSLGYDSDAEVTRMTTSVAELAFRCLQLDKDLRPSMDEVVDFLKDIQGGEDCKVEKVQGANGNGTVPGKIIPPSPETDDVVLLKNKNFQSSPNAVTDTWASSGSTTTSSIG